MNTEELMRLIGSIHMEKGIDRNLLFESLEAALVSAARKKYSDIEELRVKIDRMNGAIWLLDGDRPLKELDPKEFGRIAAQTAKQVMIQRIREAESDVVYEEFLDKCNTLVNGIIQRIERGTVICNIGKTDAILPRQEQIASESYRPGERVRCYVVSVKKKGNKVIIILSRTHPDLVRELFELEVPEIYDHIVEIRGLVREPGYRTKIAVASSDSRVDAVGACVGVRGSRIRNIVEELNGEKIDIVRWNDSSKILIANSLKPAEVAEIALCFELGRATVGGTEDQLSLAIGKRGQNVRLASKLTKWHLDVISEERYNQEMQEGYNSLMSLPGVGDSLADALYETGFYSAEELSQAAVEDLVQIRGIGEEKAGLLISAAATYLEEKAAADSKAETESLETATPEADGAAPTEDAPGAIEDNAGAETNTPSEEPK